MIKESKNQAEVLEQMTTQQGNVHQASELKRSNKDQILRFYNLVRAIGNRYG
jgi:hypothetical protein